ncbi:MAG TPA: tyrosine-protein phosphatase [Planctomycetota bacterium]|nr:tyrosine-protein phosphatase [Planctomycetota bacterium]
MAIRPGLYRLHMMIRQVLAICCSLAAVLTSAADAPTPRIRPLTWAQPVIGTQLENLYRVSPEVYRSSQPHAGDLKLLVEQLGVKSVLTLRNWHDDNDEGKGLPLTLYRVDMEADEVEPDKVAKALQIIRDAPKPILIHCWHGSDRTGLMVAAYRISVQGWEPRAATDELQNGGFGYHATMFPGIVDWLTAGHLTTPAKVVEIKP